MKRLHVHVGVADLDRSIGFYSTLFGAKPTVTKADYAKWQPIANIGRHRPQFPTSNRFER